MQRKPLSVPNAVTKAVEVRLRLAAEIVTGLFPPGYHLDETVQARRLGVSRTPLREALRQLSSMGLVENRPHRGVVVVEGNCPEVLVESLAELQATCCRNACERMSESMRAELRREFAGQGDWMAVINRASGNPVLSAMAEPLWQVLYWLAGGADACLGSDRDGAGKVVAAVLEGRADDAHALARAYAATCGLRTFATAPRLPSP